MASSKEYAVNAITKSEPRLRIVGAYYDRDRFYILKTRA